MSGDKYIHGPATPEAIERVRKRFVEAAYEEAKLADDVRVKDSGQRQEFNTGAKRDIQAGKGRFDLLQWRALFKVARQLEEGAIKYDARNWEKGIPLSRYLDSATRHLAMFAMGRTDERHDVAVAWNILCLIDTAERIKEGLLPAELDDLPKPNGAGTTDKA